MKTKIKETLEPVIQESLNKGEMECIYRHLKMFVQINWSNKQNVPDACIGCNHYCSKDKQICNPWPIFYKFSDVLRLTSEAHQGHLNKQDNDPTHL